MRVRNDPGVRRVILRLKIRRTSCVDVIVVHHGGGTHDPWIGQAGDRAPALLGAEHRRLFLSLADKHHAFLLVEFAQVLCHHGVLALALAELHERNLMLRSMSTTLLLSNSASDDIIAPKTTVGGVRDCARCNIKLTYYRIEMSCSRLSALMPAA